MHKHAWITRESGFAIECDKCGEYVNMRQEGEFLKVERTESCPVSDEEFFE